MNDYGVERIEGAIRYMIEQWDKLRRRSAKCPAIPSFGWLVACHATFVSESHGYAKYAQLIAEYEAAWEESPTKGPSAELRKRYETAKPETQRLGLVN